MRTIIKNGRIIDPSQMLDLKADLLIEDGVIKGICESASRSEIMYSWELEGETNEIIDAEGMWVVPGLIDTHVHFREPGQEYKEDIETGCLAAAAGGFTAVCTMPNTKPFIDSVENIKFIKSREVAANGVKLLQSACITVGQKGEEIVDMAALKAAGVYGFSEDGRSVDDIGVMREAMQKAKELDMPILDHTEEKALLPEGACMNAGKYADMLGLNGIPPEAEEMIAARDILLAKETGCRLHLQHISTLGSLDLIRAAKSWGIPVTAETAPHYFTLTDGDVPVREGDAAEGTYHSVDTPCGMKADTHKKMNPPLRTKRDRFAVVSAIIDGTIDTIATDHAPHSAEEKSRPFDQAPFGIVGLETSFAVSHTELVKKGFINPMRLIALMSTNAARILRYDGGTLRLGARADIAIIDPNEEWTVDPDRFKSKGRNTPFEGMKLKGRVRMTIADGKIIYRK